MKYILDNGKIKLTVFDLGATMSSLIFNGKETLLRRETEEECITGDGYLGAMVGRYGNRIANSGFTLDGKTYKLPANEGANQLHGGPMSYDKRRWTVEKATDTELRLSILSPDGDNGFPGNLKMTATYKLIDNAVRVEFEGETDAPTVFSPTVHPYFATEKCELQIDADSYLELGEGLIPTGRILPCDERYDFSTMRPLDKTYDNAFVKKGDYALTLKTENFTMEFWTDMPAAQMFSQRPGGVAIEPEFYPDSPNHDNFPSTVLRPGEKYFHWAEYRFF